jgi:porphobilinogen deaminase
VAEGTHDTVLADVERVLASHLGGACHTTIQVTARHQCCTAGDAAETSDGVGV